MTDIVVEDFTPRPVIAWDIYPSFGKSVALQLMTISSVAAFDAVMDGSQEPGTVALQLSPENALELADALQRQARELVAPPPFAWKSWRPTMALNLSGPGGSTGGENETFNEYLKNCRPRQSALRDFARALSDDPNLPEINLWVQLRAYFEVHEADDYHVDAARVLWRNYRERRGRLLDDRTSS